MDDPYRYPVRRVLPYVVLDQNCLRDKPIISESVSRAREEGELIVLTETAFYEMMKSKDWDSYYELSLVGLTEFPESVVGARSIGAMLEVEERDGIPQRYIVDDTWTSMLREHLTNLRVGPDKIMEINKIFAARLQDGMFNTEFYERNKAVLVRMVKDLSDNLPPEFVKNLRQRNRQALVNFMASDEVMSVCIDSIRDSGHSRDVAIMLALEPSVSSYHFLSTLALALKWVALGGIEMTTPERLNNDSLDMDYITISLFCKKLISKDQEMTWIYSVLREAIDRRWQTVKGRLEDSGLI